MKEVKEFPVYSRDQLETTTKVKKKKVLIFDFDDTLFARDLQSLANFEGDELPEVPQYLVGGNKTKSSLNDLHNLGAALCIATNKNEEGAREALDALKKEGIEQYFDFIVYEKTADKRDLLTACKSHYQDAEDPQPQFLLIDDNEQCLASARELGISALDPKTASGKSPNENAEALKAALDEAKQSFTPSKPSQQSAPVRLQPQPQSPRTKKRVNEAPTRIAYPVGDDKSPREWLLSSGFFITNLWGYIHIHRATRQKYSPSQFREGFAQTLFSTAKFFTRDFTSMLTSQFLFSIGFDGYNPVNSKITSADGETTEYSGSSLPFWLMLASFLGLPSRPESVKNGVPQFNGWQLLRNFLGVWNPVKETLSNEDGSLSFYQKRWTEKKIIQGLLFSFKLLVILPLKLLIIPFKIVHNTLKLVTELLLPLLSATLGFFNNLMLGLTYKVSTIKPLLPIAFILGLVTAALTLVQYGTMLLCRIALAFSSPEKSARLAYALGHSLTIGTKGSWLQVSISRTVGALGAILSLVVSGVLWAFTLPLAINALITAIPSILTAITWVSQLPFVLTAVAWLSQFHLITTSAALLNNLFGIVSTALATTLGPLVTTLATYISLQVPTALIAAGTTIGLLAVPVAAVLSRGLDELSNLWVKWVEQAPFAALFSRPAKAVEPGSEPKKLSKGDQHYYIYQPLEGEEYIVSKDSLYLTAQTNELLQAIEVKGKKAQQLYERALANPEHSPEWGARLATETERLGTEEKPAQAMLHYR